MLVRTRSNSAERIAGQDHELSAHPTMHMYDAVMATAVDVSGFARSGRRWGA
ncbi:hypothetical protein GS491_23685 [Rhodococcus hoagii]|nr:hypothetical protein [Prescottella equi]NKR23458.1 hypothetical protein [Prescottella equi]NKR80198.1 hypothetical protein [Prescottella equi]NKT55930.1 hypothetical protein [Prescottella equi]NKU37451.1 hypothetical protein [Prescottella equi]